MVAADTAHVQQRVYISIYIIYQDFVISVLCILSLCLKVLGFKLKFRFVKQIKALGRQRNCVLHSGDHSDCVYQDWGGGVEESANKSILLSDFVLAATSRNG